jgi:hypothetical protein
VINGLVDIAAFFMAFAGVGMSVKWSVVYWKFLSVFWCDGVGFTFVRQCPFGLCIGYGFLEFRFSIFLFSLFFEVAKLLKKEPKRLDFEFPINGFAFERFEVIEYLSDFN